MEREEIREILEKHLQRLSQRSVNCGTYTELKDLTDAMIATATYLKYDKPMFVPKQEAMRMRKGFWDR